LPDAANMAILAMEKMFKNGTYNISSNSPTTLLSLINIISKSIGKNVNINITHKHRLGDIRHLFMDNNKIKTALKFRDTTDIVNGIHALTLLL
jgi:nucleoside-diphosphate-sugar epimerase